MLKKIDGFFEKRKVVFNSSQDKVNKIKQTLQSFLKNKFGEDLAGLSIKISYDYRGNGLVITTSNKTLTNELSLCLIDLNDFLKDKQIKLDRILIR